MRFGHREVRLPFLCSCCDLGPPRCGVSGTRSLRQGGRNSKVQGALEAFPGSVYVSEV